MSHLGQSSGSHSGDNIDPAQMQQSHQALYQGAGNGGGPHTANTLGAGAAMQALKMFAGGQSGQGGSSQSQLISTAMSEAGRLFDSQSAAGNVAPGADKQSAINSAAKMALQMFMKSQAGGGAGGGASGLMSLASKFF